MAKKAAVFRLDPETLKKIAYKDIYNSVSWSKLEVAERIQILELTEYKYFRYKTEIEKQIAAYFKSLGARENVETTGKTIGEIEEEMKETEEKCSETYVLSLIEAAKNEISSKDYEALVGFVKLTKDWSEATVDFVEDLIESDKKLYLIWKN